MCNNDYTLITKEISNLVSEKNIVIWKSEMDGLGTSAMKKKILKIFLSMASL